MNKLPESGILRRESLDARFSRVRAHAAGTGAMTAAERAKDPRPTPVSPELTPLLAVADSTLSPISNLPGRRGAKSRFLQDDLGEDPWDESEVIRQRSRSGAALFTVGQSGQGSGRGNQDEDGGHGQGRSPVPQQPMVPQEGSSPRGASEASKESVSHMSGTAGTLKSRCAEHHALHGATAMPLFLRQTVIDLLPDFVRDLSGKLHAVDVGYRSPDSQDCVRPVVDVFDEFLGHLRPLYDRYADGPLLLTDARHALCAAQDLLTSELTERSGENPRLARLMRDTVNPLFAVLVMSCARPPRPADPASPGLRLASGEAA